MRLLLINDEVKTRVSEVVAFALERQNVYRPGPTSVIPGNDPRYIVTMGSYRVVFSLTEIPHEGKLYKHLSISIPDKDRFPNPIMINEVIGLFGFEGGLFNCSVSINQQEGCVVVAQPHA